MNRITQEKKHYIREWVENAKQECTERNISDKTATQKELQLLGNL